MPRVNWSRGFARLSWGLLGASWAIYVVATIVNWRHTDAGDFVKMVMLTLAWVATHRLVAWIAGGFTSSGGETVEH